MGRRVTVCCALLRARLGRPRQGRDHPRRSPRAPVPRDDPPRAARTWWAADPAGARAGLELLAAWLAGVGETGSESRRWLETFLGYSRDTILS